MTAPSVKVLTDLLARLEAAEGPDRELDARLWCLAEGVKFSHLAGTDSAIIYFTEGKPGSRRETGWDRFTASLDAALALVERTGAATGIDAAQMLHDALEHLANGGWWSDRPIGPQIANRLLIALLNALSANGASPAFGSSLAREEHKTSLPTPPDAKVKG